tara:strand:- start:65 stop:568 length:504 start_codon:yes stop_codon:yes gene_type:complete
MMQPYPVFQSEKIDEDAITWMNILKEMVIKCRSLRGEMSVSPAEKTPLSITGDKAILKEYEIYLKGLAKINDIQYLEELSNQDNPVAIVNDFKLMLNIEIDKKQEITRLKKEITRLDLEIKKANGKLKNKNFVAKAPSEVIEQEKDRLLKFSELYNKFKIQLDKFQS